MKRKDITYQDKLNELRLDIKHPNSQGQTFILVEGESDIRLFRKFFNLNNCKVECIPGGNVKLEECVDELVVIYPLIFGIRDSDFIQLNPVQYTKVNMFLTDYHDIEMSLISEDEILNALVFEFTNIPEAKHATIRGEILKSIEQVSYLKFINDSENLELKFEAGFQDIISFTKLDIDFAEYFRRILLKSPNAKITDLPTIQSKITALQLTNLNPLHLCTGHDFMKAFSCYTKANGGQKGVNHEIVCSAFRMGYRNEFFVKTQLFQKTKIWADKHGCVIHL